MNRSEVLNKAADIVTGHWMQGDYADGQGNYCLFGSIVEVEYPTVGIENDLAIRTAEQEYESFISQAILNSPYLDNVSCVTEWNDVEGRKESEVIEVLRKAAELARQDES